ncbi:MAG: transglutaminase-like domain-containing protein [Candidatus Scalindua sp.]
MRTVVIMFFSILIFSGITYASVPKTRTLDFDYEVILKDIPQDASELKIWLPLLPDNDHQIIEEVSINPSDSMAVSKDKLYGNKILNYTLTPPFESTFKINVHYKLKRIEYSNKPGNGREGNSILGKNINLDKFLKANRLVTLSSKVKELSAQITDGKVSTLEKAMAIYDYVFENVTYNKEIPGWGYGDTERVCNVKAGNCTDFHSLFISLSRASEIPARFLIGVLLERDKREGLTTKYHCWAEFYDERQGWIPVDISEAWKDKSKQEYYFGTLDENRVEFTLGRDIVLEPAQAGEPLNYFIYPYVEVDGKIFKKVGVFFKYKNQVVKKVQESLIDNLTKK